MTLKLDTIKRLYLLLAVFYYCGFMGFLTRLLIGKEGGSIESTASGSILKQLFGLEILIVGVILLVFERRVRLKKIIVNNKLWLLLILFFIISIAWSDIPTISFRRLIAFITLIVCAFVIAISFELRSLLLYLSDTIFFAAFVGLLLIFVAPDIALVDQRGGERANTFYGIFYDKNGGARCYVYALLIKIAYGKYYKNLDLIKLLMLSVCIIFSNSATAVVMMVIGFSAIISLNFLQTSNKERNLKSVILVITLGVIASILVNFSYALILELLGRDPTLTNRSIIWQLITPFVEKKLSFGYGFGAFWASSHAIDFVERWGFIGNAHSGYYEALLNGGIICLGIVIGLILKIIKDCFFIYINDVDGKVITPVLTIIVIQAIVNYVGYLILNYNSADMFVFTTLAFAVSTRYAMYREFV